MRILINNLTPGRHILNYSIHPMVKDDIDQVSEIDREAFPTQWPPPNYRQELQNRLAHYLIACDDAVGAGLPAARTRQRLFDLISRLWSRHAAEDGPAQPRPYVIGFSGIWMMADEAHITNFAVRAAYRNKGIGGLLMLATIDLAQGLKATFLTLEVRASNFSAQKLYSRYGFTQTGLRRGYYLDNKEDAIIMSTNHLTSDAFQALVDRLRQSLADKLARPA